MERNRFVTYLQSQFLDYADDRAPYVPRVQPDIHEVEAAPAPCIKIKLAFSNPSATAMHLEQYLDLRFCFSTPHHTCQPLPSTSTHAQQ